MARFDCGFDVLRVQRPVANRNDVLQSARDEQFARPTRPQVGLSGKSRQTNLHGAFAVLRSADVTGKTLLLIDDVTTTGATLNECAATLISAGTQAVYALTLAAG